MEEFPGGAWILACREVTRCRDSRPRLSMVKPRSDLRLRLGWFAILFVFIMHLHALPPPLSVECHQGPSLRALAQSISAVAHRDVYRCQDEGNRIPGVLGIHVA